MDLDLILDSVVILGIRGTFVCRFLIVNTDHTGSFPTVTSQLTTKEINELDDKSFSVETETKANQSNQIPSPTRYQGEKFK